MLLGSGNLGQTLEPLLLLPVDEAEGPGLFQQVDAALKTEMRSKSRNTLALIPHHWRVWEQHGADGGVLQPPGVGHPQGRHRRGHVHHILLVVHFVLEDCKYIWLYYIGFIHFVFIFWFISTWRQSLSNKQESVFFLSFMSLRLKFQVSCFSHLLRETPVNCTFKNQEENLKYYIMILMIQLFL